MSACSLPCSLSVLCSDPRPAGEVPAIPPEQYIRGKEEPPATLRIVTEGRLRCFRAAEKLVERSAPLTCYLYLIQMGARIIPVLPEANRPRHTRQR